MAIKGGVDGDATIEGAVQRIGANRCLSLLVLFALCFAVYVPGVVRLPAVDRTEVIYAETTRDMLSRGALADPRYDGTIHQYRPIGTFLMQALSASLAGETRARHITAYRVPGMLAVMFAVLSIYWLATPLIGGTAALIAAGLFAAAPLTVLVAQLAVAEGLSLFPATVAMLALLRIYVARPDDDTRRLALLFWTAIGLGILINALLVPIIVAVTLIALRFLDRDFSWLHRLHFAVGLPLALLIASPWIIVRAHQDGVPFSGLGLKDFVEALGGAQDMKLRAFPGTFLLALLLGFLPGTALLAPAVQKLWREREDSKIARFLLAWVLGYLVYLEALSSKPGTYMVQTMFPALAIAVATLAASEDGKSPAPKFHAIPWPPLAALFALALFACPYVFAQRLPPIWAVPLMAAVAAQFYVSAVEGRANHLVRWAVTGSAALGLFAMILLGGLLPSIKTLWPAQQIERALSACPTWPVGLLGFNEPTTRFVLNRDATLSTKAGLAKLADGNEKGLIVIEKSWQSQNPDTLTRDQKAKISPIACLHAINTMRGCALTLQIVGRTGETSCEPPPEFACSEQFLLQSSSAGAIKACD